MAFSENQVVGLIELTPSQLSRACQFQDDSLDETFDRLAHEEFDAIDERPSRHAAVRIPASSRRHKADSVIIVDSDQLKWELEVEWSRVQAIVRTL